jgi:hypothetical protein
MVSRIGAAILFLSLTSCVLGQTPPHYLAQGNSLYQQGNYAEAAKYFQAATQLDPQNWQGYQSLGNADYKLGKTEEARAAYQQSLAIHPQNPALRNFLNQMPPSLPPALPANPSDASNPALSVPALSPTPVPAPTDALPKKGRIVGNLGLGYGIASFKDLQNFYGGVLTSSQTPSVASLNLGADYTMMPNVQLGLQLEGLFRTPEGITMNGGGPVTQTWNQHALGGALGIKFLLPLSGGANLIIHGEGGYYTLVGSNVTDSGANAYTWTLASSKIGRASCRERVYRHV